MKVDDAADRAPARDLAGPAIDRISPEGRAIFVDILAEIALARVLADLDAEDAAAANEPIPSGTGRSVDVEHPAEAIAAPTRRRSR